MNQGIFGLWARRLSPTARGSLFYLGLSSAERYLLPFINVFYADRGFSGREIGLLAAAGPVVALARRAAADRAGGPARVADADDDRSAWPGSR